MGALQYKTEEEIIFITNGSTSNWCLFILLQDVKSIDINDIML